MTVLVVHESAARRRDGTPLRRAEVSRVGPGRWAVERYTSVQWCKAAGAGFAWRPRGRAEVKAASLRAANAIAREWAS